ncbi:MAG: ABC transporter permease, partial [Anaerolineae bacterium]
MTFVKRYLIPRLIQYVLVIWLGITVVFLIPRVTPNDPVMGMINQMQARGTLMEPGTMDAIIADLTEMYGLGGSWLDQYWAFWGRLLRGDFGVSFFQFPTRVNQLIATAMPWTLALLLTTTAITWTLGNIIGGLAGYYARKGWSRALDAVAMVIRPLPYYIFAFMLILLFAYVVRWFPITGGASLGALPTFTWAYIKDVLWHSALPALSLSILGGAVNFQTMKLIVQNVNAESFVQYAKLGGVTESRIVGKYVIRNALLPQITGLAMGLGQIFSGALITEIVYGYPGL